MPPATTLEEILSDPGYQGLTPDERMGIRRGFYRQSANDPGFRSLPPEDRHRVARDILFPASEYPEPKREAREKPTIGEAFSRGRESVFAPITPQEIISPASPASLRRIMGGLEMIGAPLQPAANLATRTGERVSDYLTGKGFGRVGDVAAGLTTGVGDYLTGIGLAKGLQLTKAPLARVLPTIKERIAPLQAEKATRLQKLQETEQQLTADLAPSVREKRLADLEKLANEAQAATTEAQAGRLQEIPAAREAIRERGAQGITTAEQQLAKQQQRVGLEAAKAGAPVGPKRMNFEKRYGNLEQAADQIPIRPVNLNVKAHGLTREPGIPGTPTLPSERSSAAISRTLTEADPEEIGNQVRRMLTSGADVKPLDYNAITRTVLGPATADDVTVGELLRARKRLREAGRAAYKADHKNLARQWGELEDSITEDIKQLAKTDKRVATIYRQARNLDKDYFRKKAGDWYAEGVDQAFDPAKGVWDRKRFTKWWEKFSDSTNNNRDLRRLLGDRYEQTKGLVDDMQKATELNIEQAAKEAARNVKRRMGAELREVGAREEGFGKLSKTIGEQIQAARTKGKGAIEAELAQKEVRLAKIPREARLIEADAKRQIEKITGRPYLAEFSKSFGAMTFLGGIGTTGWGVVTGNPALMGGGLGAAGAGLFTVLSHDAFIKLVNAPRGLSIARRLVRAVPGTGEAIAASSAAARVLRGLEGKEGKEKTTQALGAKPEVIPEPTAKPSTAAKESLMRKYGIE